MWVRIIIITWIIIPTITGLFIVGMIRPIVLDVLFIGWDIVIVVIIFLGFVLIPFSECYYHWVISGKGINATDHII